MKKRLVKITAFFFAVFLFCMSLVPIVGAEEFKNPMLDTYVCDDLNTYGFRLSDYPADTSSKRVSLMHFQEYGFHKDGDPRYYDLYVYVYNPSCNAIETTGNYIQLAFGESKNYKKYPLEILSHSVDDENENLFYKFKVSAIESFNKTANRGTRKYFISGIELNFRDDSRDDDYPVSQEWIYSGYQFNFGSSNPAGSLVCNVKELKTVKIDLHGARWFSSTSDYGKDFRYEVSSVYFAIPNDIIRDFGNPGDENGTSGLVSVQGTYNKYGLNGLIVESEGAYNAFQPYLNKGIYPSIQDYFSSGNFGSNDPQIKYLSSWPEFFTGGDVKSLGGLFGNKVNAHVGYSFKRNHNEDNFWDKLGSFFSPVDVDVNFYQDFLMLLTRGSSPDISKGDLTELWESSGKPCFLDPANMYIGGHTEGIGKDLHYYDISVNDGNLNSQIKSWASTRKVKFLDKLFNKKLYTDEKGYPDCKPLQEITYFNLKDLVYNEEAMCNEMFMSKADLEEFDDFYDKNHLGNHVYIMRFAVDPYYCSKGTARFTNDAGAVEESDCYYYEKVIYDNFDVLSFTFQREDGFISVVPVNCKPISIIGSVVAGSNKDNNNPNGAYTFAAFLRDLWNFIKKLKIFPILMGILLLVIFFKLIWPIFKKLGNAGLEVAKARASRPKNENRDKSPPKGEEKDKSPPIESTGCEENQKKKIIRSKK